MKRKSNILTIMKKELRRFFGDRRMVATMILPGIVIYLLYSVMGSTMMSGLMGSDGDETPRYIVHAENMPASIQAGLEASGAEVSLVTMEDPKKSVEDQAIDLYAVFPENFDALIASYDPASGDPAPAVSLYYNSSDTDSSAVYGLMTALLDARESALANRFDVNSDPDVTYDLATSEDITGMIFSMLMPMLLIMLMFSSCMAMTTDSIAGEKERGTVATLLVTPMKRSELAIGKIAALSLISLLGGLCSFFGVLLALPKLMGGEEMGMVDANIYGVVDYAWILGIILSTILVFVSLIAVISTLANTVKEATSLISPLMIVVVIIGVSGMFGGGDKHLALFLIPVYNSVQCISGVFSMAYEPAQIILTIISNCVAAGLLVFVLARMFNSEKVMFKK